MNTDVLVVGAGPTGLMLASQLARRGIRVAIVDRHSGPAQQTRAMAVHARTLEIYAQLGIAAQALQLGQPTEGANMWANGERTARIPLGDIGRDLSPFPYVLMLGQDDNERIMGDKLRDCGVDVRWNTELVALAQKSGCVEAVLKQPDGTSRTLEAAYVAGCDGVHSAVRELSGIAFPGAPYEHVFFVADTEATGSMAPGELNVFFWRRGFHLFFPMRGRNRWRVIGILPQRLSEQPDLAFEQLIPAIRGEAGTDLAFQACHWFSTYRIHHRCAERFRDRRCFLLGDAAHVHSPVGGQGMNTGLQDAYNLAWKLALAVAGRAGDSLLESYAQERRAVAQNLLRSTDRAFTLLVSDSAFAGLFRSHVFARVVAVAMRFPRVRERLFGTISQIGIHYRASALSETAAGGTHTGPRAGDRFPWLKLKFKADGRIEDLFERLDDTRFNLIVVGQALPQPAALPVTEAFVVHAVAADPTNDEVLKRAGIPTPSYFVLRPDGYIALAGGRIEAQDIERYFAGRDIGLSPYTQSESALHGFAPGVIACVLATTLSLTPSAHAADGAAVYQAKCSACHDSGAGEAPRTAMAADWTERFAAGRAALHAAAIRGVPNTAMAPKGGFAELTDDEVRAAVDYMLARTGYVDRAPTSVAQAPERTPAPAHASPAEGAVADADLLRQVAKALRNAIAPPGTAIEADGSELSIRGTGVRVSAAAGVVRLMGVVANGAAIKRAEEAARSVGGVRRVDNKLITRGMLDFD